MSSALDRWLRPASDGWLLPAALLVLLLGVATGLNFQNTRRQHEIAGWVTHTHLVIDALTLLAGQLKSAQASQRNYELTGEWRDIEASDEAVDAARRSADEVAVLTRDNAAQQAATRTLQEHITTLRRRWQEIAIIRAEAPEGAASAAAMHQAAKQMDVVIAWIERMQGIERDLLAQRSESAERAYRTALITGLLTGVGALLFVVAFSILLRRHLRRGRADAEALRQLSSELQAADTRKDRFLATLAHELRNPLAPVRNAAAILAASKDESPRVAWASDMIQRQVGHMASLLDDLLDVARITQGKLQLHPQRVELTSVVKTAVEAASPLIERKGHRFETRLTAETITVDVDPVRLAQALTNLLTNAAKYTDPGGHLVLEAQARGADLVVRVEDDGIGIAPQALDQLFNMFVQVDTAASRSEGGLGIGLALTRGIVALHGGRVWARSDGPGQGSEFVLEIPGVVTGRASLPVDTAASSRETATARGLRILIADDNHDAAESLAVVVQSAGHETRIANCGREAIDLAQSFLPDVALLDIGMPDMDGYAVARSLRETVVGRRLQLVAVTGWGQADDRRRSKEAGFDAHLTKPVDPEQLKSLIRAA